MTDKPRNSNSNATPNVPGTNPNLQSQNGGINPSAPSSGTEQWGNTADERNVLGPQDPAHTRAGQMKGNPGDNQTEMAQRMSAAAGDPNSPRENSAGNNKSFRCADGGSAGCSWEISGTNEEDIVNRAIEHGRRDHGWADWTEAMREKIRRGIKNRSAAA